jgi:hypothetical protein
MTFRDPQLENVYRRNFDVVQDMDDSQRQICGLFAAYDWFRSMEGEHSARVTEARELLLSMEIRSALRHWYRQHGDQMNPAAIEMREHLSHLAGERFGETTGAA